MPQKLFNKSTCCCLPYANAGIIKACCNKLFKVTVVGTGLSLRESGLALVRLNWVHDQLTLFNEVDKHTLHEVPVLIKSHILTMPSIDSDTSRRPSKEKCKEQIPPWCSSNTNRICYSAMSQTCGMLSSTNIFPYVHGIHIFMLNIWHLSEQLSTDGSPLHLDLAQLTQCINVHIVYFTFLLDVLCSSWPCGRCCWLFLLQIL